MTQSLRDKLQWIKYHDVLPLKTTLADKYLAKLWVRKTLDDKIRQCPEQLDFLGDQRSGRDYVTQLVGVWNTAYEIDFDLLPERFALKANHGAGFNIVVKDKVVHNIDKTLEPFDTTKVRDQLNNWLAHVYSWGQERHYIDIPRRVIAEELIPEHVECQFYCTNGVPRYMSIITPIPRGAHQNIYDMNFALQPLSLQRCRNADEVPAVNFRKLKTIAEWLCGGFKFVREDLLSVGDKVYFGEMTFTPYAMDLIIQPKEYEDLFNSMLDINKND